MVETRQPWVVISGVNQPVIGGAKCLIGFHWGVLLFNPIDKTFPGKVLPHSVPLLLVHDAGL